MQLRGGEQPVEADVHVFGVGRVVFYARVEQVHNAVLFNGAARKAPVRVGGLCGKERYLKVPPAYKVAAYGVPPVHSPPARGVGEVLIEQVVLSIVEYKAVGVVYPAPWRFKVKCVHRYNALLRFYTIIELFLGFVNTKFGQLSLLTSGVAR